MISGLHEVVKEVVTARLAANEALLFDARVTAIDDLKRNPPVIRYRTGQDGDERAIECASSPDAAHRNPREWSPHDVTASRGGAPSHGLSAHSRAVAANPIRWFK
jgi:hypothetical protein